jgi:prophage maintenance system killer protein
LYLNGDELEPEENDEVATMVALADGSLSEEQLVGWLRANAK